jgi:hypothetical protein
MQKEHAEQLTKRTAAWLAGFQKTYVECLIAHYAKHNISEAVRMSLVVRLAFNSTLPLPVHSQLSFVCRSWMPKRLPQASRPSLP